MEPLQKQVLFSNTYIRLQKTAIALQNRKLQLDLLLTTKANVPLLHSGILSSILPSIGKCFTFSDLEKRKKSLLHDIRINFLELAVIEAERDIINLTNDFNILKLRIASDFTYQKLN